jgi:leader peptidase (prepilin peptidase) / N-methyltransferase
MAADPGFFPGLLLAAFLGLVLGSFATALSYRLPRGISMWTKARSACTSCGRDLEIPDLVPLFSWLFLKGQCRRCRAPIGLRYPLIETATLALCLGFYCIYGLSAQGLALFALAPVLVAIVDIDLHHKIIPDSLNLAVLLLGFSAWFLGADGIEGAETTFGGMIVYAAFAFLLRKAFALALKREPMGLGDVKFFGAAGFWLTFDAGTAAQFMMLSGAFGVALALLWRRVTGEDEFPFGPALVLAFTVLLFRTAPFAA